MSKQIAAFFVCFALFLTAAAHNNNIDSLKKVLPTQKGSDQVRTMLELCWEYRFSNADTARQYGIKALELARDAKDENLEVEALHNIGVTYEAQSEYTDALSYERKALELRKK